VPNHFDMKSIIATLLIILSSSLSLSAQCSKIRLDENGGPLDGATVSDQDGLNICRQESGAKILDCLRYYANGGKRPKFETSAIPLAIQFAANGNLPEIEQAANSAKMIDFGAKYGVCSREAVRKRFGSNTNRNYCSEVKTVLRSITANTNIGATSGSNYSCNLKKDENNFIKATTLLSKALEVDESIYNLQNEMSKICKNEDYEKIPKAPPAKQLFGYELTTPAARFAAFKKVIDEQLGSFSPMPTEVIYCFDFMMANQSSEIGIDQTSGKHTNALCNKEGLHASIISGRRPGPRGCQYLIHNSHGTSCNAYDSKWDCESGKIWVDEESLFKNTMGLTYIDQGAP
jgi:hypothetical protein